MLLFDSAGGLDLLDLSLELVVVLADRHLELVLLLQREEAQDRSRGNHCCDAVEKHLLHGRLFPLQGGDVLRRGVAVDRLGQIDLGLLRNRPAGGQQDQAIPGIAPVRISPLWPVAPSIPHRYRA